MRLREGPAWCCAFFWEEEAKIELGSEGAKNCVGFDLERIRWEDS